MTKTEMIAALAETTGLDRRQVVGLFDELAKLIEKELDDGAGAVNIFNLLKVKVVRNPATPERKPVCGSFGPLLHGRPYAVPHPEHRDGPLLGGHFWQSHFP